MKTSRSIRKSPFILQHSWSVALVAVGFALTDAAHADRTWNVGTGDWNTPANWTGSVLPGSGDNAIVNSGTANLTVNEPNVNDILVNNGVTNGTGIVNQTAGSITANGWLRMGLGTNGTATYNLGGTGTTSAGRVVIGESSAALFIMTGGTLNSSSELWLSGVNSGTATGNGTMNMSGGIVNVSSWLAVGRNGAAAGAVGSLNISGGVFNAATASGAITIGGGTNAQGVVTVSGTGTLTSPSFALVGENGIGTLTVSGSGLVSLGEATNGLRLAANGGSTGTVTLNGGTILTKIVTKGGGSGTFNFDGGTLKANASSTTFMEGLTLANVKAGGAFIDTNGNTITINQSLIATVAGNLLTKSVGAGTLTLGGTGDNVSLAATAMTGTLILGKTSSGTVHALGSTLTVAGGIAQLGGSGNDQIYTQANVVVNSGTFDFNGKSEGFNILSGSGGTITNTAAATTSTIIVGENGGSGTYAGVITDGGAGKVVALTKTGAGTQTLTGNSTFTGAVTVNQGILAISGDLGTSGARTGNPFNVGSTAAATVSQTAGNVWVNGELYVGNNTGAAVYNLSGGTLNVNSWVAVGRADAGGAVRDGTLNVSGNAVLNQTGGGFLTMGGFNSTASVGRVNLSNTATINALNIYVSESGTGIFTIQDTATANTALLRVGAGAGSSGTVHLNGGTVAPTQVASGGAGTSVFNFNGGTLKANAGANATFFTGLTTANVRNVRSTIDSNGQDITIGQALLHSTIGGDAATDGGLTKIGAGTLTLSAQNTFNGGLIINAGTLAATVGVSQIGRLGQGPVTVNVAGTLRSDAMDAFGYLTGAPSVLNIVGGTVTTGGAGSFRTTLPSLNMTGGTVTSLAGNLGDASGVFSFNQGSTVTTNATTTTANITAPQVGMEDVVTFNVPRGTAPVADLAISSNLTNVTYGVNPPGAITKTGNGILSLSGTGSYTGPTTVSNGTLLLSGAGSVNATSGITVSGSGAKLVQDSSTVSTPTITLTQGTLDGTGTVGTVLVGNNTGGIVTNGDGGSGALTIGALTFNGVATVTARVAANTNPGIVVSGALTSVPGLVLGASNSTWTNGLTYRLISYNTFTGNLSDFAITNARIENLGARQAGTLTNPAGFISLQITGDLPIWTGVASLNWTSTVVGGPFNWKKQSDNLGTEFLVTNDTPLFDDSASAARTAVNISGANVSPASTTFNNSTNNYTVSSAGGFGITGGLLIKSGTGSLALNTTNTYAGGTTLNGGTLVLNNASAIGTGALTISGGTTLDSTSGPTVLTTVNAQNWNGDFTFGGTSNLSLGTGAVTLSASRTVTTNGSAALTVGGAIAGGGFGLTKAGPGTLILSGANTFTGAVAVNAGTLVLGGTNSFTGGITVNNSSTLQLNASQSFTGGVTINNAGTVQAGNAGAFNTVTPNAVAFGAASTGLLQLNGNSVTVGGLTTDVTPGTPAVENGAAGTATLTVSNATANTYAGVLRNGAVGTLALTKGGGGTLTLTNSNTYTGATLIGAGTLEIIGSAVIGNTASITERSGATFRIDGLGGGVTIAAPVTLDLNGGAAFGANANGNGNGNFAIDIVSGTAATFTGLLSNASGSFVKRGAGALTLTNAGANVLANVGFISAIVQDGSLTLNGGAGATYAVTGGELTIGDNTPNQASLTLASGTLTVGTYVSIGRGNGTSGLQSALNVTGGTLNTVNLFTGYDNGVGGYNASPLINAIGGAINATTIRFGESAGGVTGGTTNMNLGGNAILTATGDSQIGFGGRGVVSIFGNAIYNLPQLSLGMGNNSGGNTAVGVINQTGGTVQQAGAFGNDWRIGGYNGTNDQNVYGAYNISAGALNTGGRFFQIGAFGSGVLDLSGTGTVTSTGGYLVVGRFINSTGLLNISSGTFNQTNAGFLFIIGEDGAGVVNVSGTGAFSVAAGVGGAGTGGGTGGLRLGFAATGSGQLNLNGGTVTATGIADNAGQSFLYLNGGTVKAGASNATFLQGLDNAVVGPGGAIFDTNANTITVGQTLTAPVGLGVTTIPVLTGGAGYLGQPIVKITGDGTGATAIANVSGGVVTGITITNPGINYTFASATLLTGSGGATTAATLDVIAPAANTTTGGLTKNGNGTLTLTAANTYTGGTALNVGTLIAANNSALGTGTVTIAATATRLIVNDGLTLANAITINGGTPGVGTGLIQGSGTGTSTITGPITITASTANGGHFAGGGVGTLVVNGAITSSVTVAVRSGSTVFSGGGSYAALNLSGQSKIGANNGFSTSAVADIAPSDVATLDLNGFNQELAGLTRVSANSATVFNSSGTASVLNLNVSGANSYAYSGFLNGNLALTKSGTGTETLSALSNYTGGTALTGGTLNINGDGALGAAAGGLAISNGATLQAAANVTTARTITLSTVAGGKIDTNGQTVTLDTGGTVTGTALEKTGAGTLNISATQTYSALTTSGGTTNIYTALGTGSSTLTANATTNIYASQTLASLTIADGVEVTFGDGLPFAPAPEKFGATGVVPEPGALALLVAGTLGLLGRRRRGAQPR